MKTDILKTISIIADFLTIIGVISTFLFAVLKKEVNLTAFKISRILQYMVRIGILILVTTIVFRLWKELFFLGLQISNGEIINLYYWESGFEIDYFIVYIVTLCLILPLAWILGTFIWTSSWNCTKDFVNLFLPKNKLLIKYKPKLEIIKASYETPEKGYDITSIVKQMIVNDTLTIVSSNQLAGDPHYGVVKKLIIDYKYDDKLHKIEAAEGTKLILP